MRREGKPGPFIPTEVRAQTGPARATMPMPARWRRRATRAVGARPKRPRSGNDVYAQAETPAPARECMHAGDNVRARATTGGAWEGCFSHKHPKLQRSCDGICARATMPASGRQRLRPCDDGCRAGGVFFHKHPKLQHSSDDVCVRPTMPTSGRRRPHARGRQRLRPCDDGCRVGGVFFHKHPKLQRLGDDVYVRATTLAHGQRRPRSRDDVWIPLS